MGTEGYFYLFSVVVILTKPSGKVLNPQIEIAILTPEFYETKETNSYRFFS